MFVARWSFVPQRRERIDAGGAPGRDGTGDETGKRQNTERGDSVVGVAAI